MKINLDEKLNKPVFEYQKLQDKLKITKVTKPKAYKYWPKSWKTVFFKSYPRFEEIILPKPKMPAISYKKLLFQRHSRREFSHKPVKIDQIGSLLFYSAGLRENKEEQKGNRFYPSGGGRYPLEVYIVSLNTQLPNGLYHYYLRNHSLEKLLEIDKFEVNKYFVYDWIENGSFIILITAVFPRTSVKYGERAYPLVMTEAGALIQNIYLSAQSLNLGCCAVAGFVEDKLNELIDIDGIHESVVGTIVLGGKV